LVKICKELVVSWFPASNCVILFIIILSILLLNAEPAKRAHGHFGLLGMLVMLGSTICGAIQQLRWTPKGLKFLH